MGISAATSTPRYAGYSWLPVSHPSNYSKASVLSPGIVGAPERGARMWTLDLLASKPVVVSKQLTGSVTQIYRRLQR